MALSKTTQNHDEIRAWAEKRGGRPADVASTESNGEAGIIRLEFPDAPNANDDNLKEIDWEPFFKKFDESGLAMVYQEVTSEGAESNFCKFVKPENLSESAKKSLPRKSTGKTPAKTSAKKSIPAKVGKAPARKSTAKPAALKKSTAKKSVAKSTSKTTAKKSAAKKVPAKTAAKKTVVRKAVTKKTVAKKATAKKTAKRR